MKQKYLSLLLVTTVLTGCGGDGVTSDANNKPSQGVGQVSGGALTISQEVIKENATQLQAIRDNVSRVFSLVGEINAKPLAAVTPEQLKEVVGFAPILLKDTLQVYGVADQIIRKAADKYKAFDPKADFSAAGWDKLIELHQEVKFYREIIGTKDSIFIPIAQELGLSIAPLMFSMDMFEKIEGELNSDDVDPILDKAEADAVFGRPSPDYELLFKRDHVEPAVTEKFNEMLKDLLKDDNKNKLEMFFPGLLAKIEQIEQAELDQLPSKLTQVFDEHKTGYIAFQASKTAFKKLAQGVKKTEKVKGKDEEKIVFESLDKLEKVVKNAVEKKTELVLDSLFVDKIQKEENGETWTKYIFSEKGVVLGNAISDSMAGQGFIRLYNGQQAKPFTKETSIGELNHIADALKAKIKLALDSSIVDIYDLAAPEYGAFIGNNAFGITSEALQKLIESVADKTASPKRPQVVANKIYSNLEKKNEHEYTLDALLIPEGEKSSDESNEVELSFTSAPQHSLDADYFDDDRNLDSKSLVSSSSSKAAAAPAPGQVILTAAEVKALHLQMYKAFVKELILQKECQGLFDFLKTKDGFKDDAEFMKLFLPSATKLSAGMIRDISAAALRKARMGSGEVDLSAFKLNGASGQSIELGMPLFVQLKGDVSSAKSTESATGSVAYRLGNTVIGAIQGYANSGAGFGIDSRQLETSVVASHSFGSFFVEGQIGSVSATDVHESSWSGYRSQITMGLDTEFVSPFVQVSHRQLDRDGEYGLNDTTAYVGLDMDIAKLAADTYSIDTRLLAKAGYGSKNWSAGSNDLGSTTGFSGSVEWSASLNLNSGVSFSSNLSLDTLAGSSAAVNVSLDR